MTPTGEGIDPLRQAVSSGGTEDLPQHRQRMSFPRLLSVALVVAMLYFAREVFLPLSIAVLITFALTPLVTILRRLGMPNLPSVLVVVATAFVAMTLFCLVVTSQVGQLAQNLPTFQTNLLAKVDGLKEAGGDGGFIGRVTNVIVRINAEISDVIPDGAGGAQSQSDQTAHAPMPVELVERRSPVALLLDLVLPLLAPIATVGLVTIVVVFMLLEREELRDRFIRLVGTNDLHRTTQVLEDAGQRVARYLLMQLLVNTIYAVPIGFGLWLIGVPNPLLWALLTLILRFVPYIGSILAAAFPLFLAVAATPDWTAVLFTAALFAAVELITSNIIEPWLYGTRIGVSPLAIIIAAIFWTWMWGPLGLVLSTPLTVCLVVLGRHIPQLEIFDILFGDEPALAPHAGLYQRLLVGDRLEAMARAEEALESVFLAEYYRDVCLPALLLAQNDYARGVLSADREERLTMAALSMVTDLNAVVADERESALAAEAIIPAAADTSTDAEGPILSDRLDGKGFRVACVGGRTMLDTVSAALLAQAMASEGAEAVHHPYTDLAPSRLAELGVEGLDCLIFSFLDPNPSRASLMHVRRIKRMAPKLRVGVVIWEMPLVLEENVDPLRRVAPVEHAKLAAVEALGGDFAVTNLEDAFSRTFVREQPRKVPMSDKRQSRAEALRRAATEKRR